MRRFAILAALLSLTSCAFETDEGDDMPFGSIFPNRRTGRPPAMTPTPKSGWSMSGILYAGKSAVTIPFQVTFPKATNYTIQFNKAVDLAATYPPFSEALIQFTVEGNFVQRRVSLGNGTSITGMAQSAQVVLSDVTNPVTASGQPYNVSLQITEGQRASGTQPPMLAGPANVNILAGAGLFIPIPTDAGVTSYYAFVFDNVTATVPVGSSTIYAMAGGVIMSRNVPSATPIWVPLIPGATNLDLQNSGPNAQTYSIIWGIDG